MFGAVGSFFGKMLGSDKALSGVVDGVTNGLDKLVYTSEEKADDAAKATTEARQMVIDWMRSTQGQNLARRLIALSVTGVWLFHYVLASFLNMVAVFTNAAGVVTAVKLQAAGVIAKSNANDMEAAVMLILAFYFAAPHMGKIATAAMSKFGNKKAGD